MREGEEEGLRVFSFAQGFDSFLRMTQDSSQNDTNISTSRVTMDEMDEHGDFSGIVQQKKGCN